MMEPRTTTPAILRTVASILSGYSSESPGWLVVEAGADDVSLVMEMSGGGGLAELAIGVVAAAAQEQRADIVHLAPLVRKVLSRDYACPQGHIGRRGCFPTTT